MKQKIFIDNCLKSLVFSQYDVYYFEDFHWCRMPQWGILECDDDFDWCKLTIKTMVRICHNVNIITILFAFLANKVLVVEYTWRTDTLI
ncbi:hypothetical protein RCL_jg11664.t1 [Rhizophagus clarus]|uniref:Uncharacterized protein n=1 Tax=Rhizophagus clarus TaxID=94130 RepID=A0A8H3R7G9_9GLOM|nr:hypothetical protein RCL_jg11664.t1 [Rhizophagus clarus]